MEYIIGSFIFSIMAAACSLNMIVINKRQSSDTKEAKKEHLYLLIKLFNSVAILFLTIQCFKNMQALN